MKKLFACLSLILLSCGEGGLYTRQPSEMPNESADEHKLQQKCTEINPCNVDITRNAFIFGSDFPADVIIPDIEGMRDTAFVVTVSNPTGVLAIDLTTNPLSISKKFNGLISPSGTGYPSSLFIMSPSRAFLLTSTHVIDFNPTNGIANKSLPLSYTIAFSDPLPLSDSSSTVTSLVPSYPSRIATMDSKLYITTSNYINPLSPAVAAPGTVLVFDVFESDPFLKSRTYIVTTDYNPSGITPIQNGALAVTNSGISDLSGSIAVPKTKASIDIIDAATNTIISNIPMGIVGLSFDEMAVAKDGSKAFIGSISYGEIYEINLRNFTAVHDHNSPITVTGNNLGSDYLPSQALNFDDSYLFVSSFEQSAVYPIKIDGEEATSLPKEFTVWPFVIGYPSQVSAENPTGTNTGAGPIAVRPGRPGEDFTGADIFVATGYPGTLVAINTNYKGETKLATPENPAPTENIDEPASPPIATDVPEDTSEDNDKLYTELTVFPKLKIDPKIFLPKLCTGYASAIIDVKISLGGGRGFFSLPDVVLGPPEPPDGDYGEAGAAASINGVLSLGPGGSIILDTKECKIIDGEGPDFIVFENAFFIATPQIPISSLVATAITDPEKVSVFSEPATVSVSEDGVNYYTFPCDPEKASIGSFYDKLQSNCAGVTPTLAEKDPLIAGLEDGAGGDAFDLSSVGLKQARYIKIVSDGTFQVTPDPDNPGTGPAGFDIDAISIINGKMGK